MSKKRKLHQIKIAVPHSSIRLQLITGFLVPIIFIIIIGVVSYQKSYEGLTRNYEKSALTAIDMTVKETSSKMIAGIHVIPVEGTNVITTQRLSTSEMSSL